MKIVLAKMLCVFCCFFMILTVSADNIDSVAKDRTSPTINLDGFLFMEIPGYDNYFVAKHIKIDEISGNIYAFKNWIVDGVDIANTTSLDIFFVMPNNDVTLTPNYYLLGNVDKDENGTIAATDVFSLIKGIKNGVVDKEFDVNLDGIVTASDKLALLQILKGTYDVTELYYTVNVEGKDVAKYENPVSNYGTIEIPLVAILESYGAEFEWESDTIATVKYKEDQYMLNTAEFTMVLEGDKYSGNYLIASAGGYITHTVGVKEIYMESYNAIGVLQFILNDYKMINFDFSKRIINIIDNPNFN